MNGVEQSTLTVTSGLTVCNEHTLLLGYAVDAITQGSLEVFRHILFTTSNLVYELHPTGEREVLSGERVVTVGHHREKITRIVRA